MRGHRGRTISPLLTLLASALLGVPIVSIAAELPLSIPSVAYALAWTVVPALVTVLLVAGTWTSTLGPESRRLLGGGQVACGALCVGAGAWWVFAPDGAIGPGLLFFLGLGFLGSMCLLSLGVVVASRLRA